MMQDAQPK